MYNLIVFKFSTYYEQNFSYIPISLGVREDHCKTFHKVVFKKFNPYTSRTSNSFN